MGCLNTFEHSEIIADPSSPRYVDFQLSRETASKIGNCRTYITNILYHNALGAKTEEVIQHLFDLREDVRD